MLVSKSKVGGLIGKRGANITHIRNTSRCRVTVHGKKDVPGHPDSREITLQGTKREIQDAKRLIQDRLAQVEIESAAHIDSAGNNGYRQPPPPHLHSQTSQYAEHHHQQQRQSYNSFKAAPIQQYDRAASSSQKYNSYRNEAGPSKAQEQYGTHSKSSSLQPPPGAKRFSMSVPSDVAGRIIGSAGSAIKEIRRLSNADVLVAGQETAVNGMREVTIIGTDEQIQSARYLISIKAHNDIKYRAL